MIYVEVTCLSLVLVKIWKQNLRMIKWRIPAYLLACPLTLIVKALKISVDQGWVLTSINISKHSISYLV